jgi:two-component system response regulator AtoC
MDSTLARRTILVGEDESEVRNYLEVSLRCRGYDVESAVDGEEVLSYVRAGHPVSAVLLDVMMPNKDGFETLREIRQLNAHLPVIMVSGMSSPLNIVQAMKSGATDFLAKPVSHEDLSQALRHAMESCSASSDPTEAVVTSPALGEDIFFGLSPAMRTLRSCLPKVAASDVPVLIQGETGTGKEVLARHVHALSPRAGKPFVKVNCAAVPADLMESELFGYERGAFTGAFQRKPGVFELADGGTILLDEIGDMDIRLQAKLLQVLQDHEFRRLGGRDNVRVNVRVIAATHRNLLDAVYNQMFREDLYYRLNVVALFMPPLRERGEDIPGIAEFLISRHSSREAPPVALTPRLKDALQAFDWPGNVRQLENIVLKLMVMRDADVIVQELKMTQARPGRAQQIARPTATPTSSVFEQATRAKEQAEAGAILDALNSTRWNRKQAAAMLNIDYKAFLYKMKRLSIEERAGKASLPN